MNKSWKLLLLAPALVTLTSCETPEDQQLASSQQCIDAAKTSSDADICYASVAGLESEKAYLIRCSAGYIAQGFTGARFASAFQRLKDNPSSGQDPMATVMAYLIFSKPSTTYSSADNTLTNCTKSGVRAMVRLATMTKLATFIATSGLGGIPANADPTDPSFDPAAISTAIANLANSGSAADQAAVGNIAIQANTAYCNEGSSFENNEICVNLKQALAGSSDPTTIGQALLAQLQHVN
ncbi:hypothetical protein BH10BDE1_BH10BDE1_07260 [soil metagenome]